MRRGQKRHVKSVEEENFRAGVQRERNGWGHEINSFHGRICQEIERIIHIIELAKDVPAAGHRGMAGVFGVTEGRERRRYCLRTGQCLN